MPSRCIRNLETLLSRSPPRQVQAASSRKYVPCFLCCYSVPRKSQRPEISLTWTRIAQDSVSNKVTINTFPLLSESSVSTKVTIGTSSSLNRDALLSSSSPPASSNVFLPCTLARHRHSSHEFFRAHPPRPAIDPFDKIPHELKLFPLNFNQQSSHFV